MSRSSRVPYLLILVHERGTHHWESPRRALVLVRQGHDLLSVCGLPAVLAAVPDPQIMFTLDLLLHPDDALQIGEAWVYAAVAATSRE